MQPVFRFAPSPNGLLHRGHAFSALTNDALARRVGGRLLLRIEDIDPQRSREAYVAAIEEDLAWLGLSWETPVLRQSRQMNDYARALEGLRARGLVYRCFCSRGDTLRFVATFEERGQRWPRDPDGAALHAGPCAALSDADAAARAGAGDPHVWRLRMADALAMQPRPLQVRAWNPVADSIEAVAADATAWGDVVVARRDVPTSYHLSVVVDDARQGITHVVRGADLEAATAVHRVLQVLLDVPEPLYFHHRLLLDDDGRKLAKSRLSLPLRSLREVATAAEVRAELGFPGAAGSASDSQHGEPEGGRHD
jgi:glutamyl-Q tRNA(Asp) synthetase